MLPRTFGRYAVKRLIGQGGFGQVYLARDPLLEREVAIKTPAGAFWAGEDVLAEARALARLSHPAIVAVLDAGIEEGQAYIVLELVPGGSLESALVQWKRTFEPDEAVEILRPCAEAIDHAHEKGILHRDLKPGNLLAPSTPRLLKADASDPSPRLKVADLGLASLVARHGPATSRPALGDPRYISPEAWRGAPTPSSDVFSLAAIAFRMIAGVPPLDGTPAELVVLAAQPERLRLSQARPDLPRSLDDALAEGLAPQRTDRPRTARELMERLAESATRRAESKRVAREARSRITSRDDAPRALCPECRRPLHPLATTCPFCG
jgi:serine/threonine protein kinase